MADPAPTPTRTRNYLLSTSGEFRRDIDEPALVAALADPGSRVWVDIDSNDPDCVSLLERVFHFHPLAIEDTQNPKSRVKVDEYANSLFVNVRVVRFCESTPEDPYDLETFNLYLFIGRNFLVTVRAEPLVGMESVADSLERNPERLSAGPARLAHAILDAAVDAYFPILDQFDEFIEKLEDRVFNAQGDGPIQDVFDLRHAVTYLRRYLAPQREVFNVLTNRPSPFIPQESQLYFRDLYDHMLRINDTLDSFRELLSSVLETHFSQVSNRLGAAGRNLAMVATVSLPFVVIAGLFGMNVKDIPYADHPHAFEYLVAVQLAFAIGLVIWLRFRKLI
jgi:magnesium transporter